MKLALKVVLMFLALLGGTKPSFSETVSLQWDPNPGPSIVAYHVYYGVISQTYTNLVVVDANTTSVTVSNLTGGLVYYFAATTINSDGLESDFSGEVAYQVGSVPCGLSVVDVVQTYDGTPKAITVITSPPDLPAIVTYAGMLDPPVDIGQYPVTVVVIASGCVSGVSTTLTITPPGATVQLDNLDQVYDGSLKAATVSTSPPDLPVTVTYNGLAASPIDAGTYFVLATVDDPNYSGTASGTLTIEKQDAIIQFTNLNQVYDGTPKPAVATTQPDGLAVSLTYNGLPQAPSAPGVYTVMGTVMDEDYQGSASGLMTISPASSSSAPVSPINSSNPPAWQVSSPTTPIASAQPFIVSWPAGTAGLTLWQSTDLQMWIPLSNIAGTSNSMQIIPQAGTLFFRATTAAPQGSAALPLSITRP